MGVDVDEPLALPDELIDTVRGLLAAGEQTKVDMLLLVAINRRWPIGQVAEMVDMTPEEVTRRADTVRWDSTVELPYVPPFRRASQSRLKRKLTTEEMVRLCELHRRSVESRAGSPRSRRNNDSVAFNEALRLLFEAGCTATDLGYAVGLNRDNILVRIRYRRQQIRNEESDGASA